MKNFGDFHLPDLNDSEFIARVKEEQRKRFEAQKRDENEFSYWFHTDCEAGWKRAYERWA